MLKVGEVCFCQIFGDTGREITRKQVLVENSKVRIVIEQEVRTLRIPWGLICDPDHIPHSHVPFWGVEYNLSVNLNGSSNLNLNNGNDDDASWSFISILHEEYDKIVEESLPCDFEHPVAYAVKENLTPIGGRVNLSRSKNQDIEKCFIYVYAHSVENKQLALKKKPGWDDKIYPIDILSKFVSKTGKAIFFINACNIGELILSEIDSIAGQIEDREVVYIVPEVSINSKFAMEFGLEFVYRCCHRGEDIVDIMKDMRNKHAPMSIVYSIYLRTNFGVKAQLQLTKMYADKFGEAIKSFHFSPCSV